MCSSIRRKNTFVLAAGALLAYTASAQAGTIQTVFVIAMENHNWTQPASQSSP
jgi:hypothetical protein